MQLVSMKRQDGAAIGVVVGEHADEVVDLSEAAPQLPRGMCKFLAAGDAAIESAASAAGSGPRTPLRDVDLLPVVPRPRKFLGVGLNYAKHVAETGREAPTFPTIFNKQVTCVNAHGGAIVVPEASAAVDYEGELAFVIGRRCRHVSKEQAPGVIAGYTICNDVSVRDWQRRAPTMILGKGWDTHGPLGPMLTTADAVGDPHDLRIRTWVNDELRQDGSTSQMIFNCFELVETLSTVMTLEPGDVVSTGTPDGVGVARSPQAFLVPGDLVRIEIEGLGVLENPVVAEG